MILLLRIQMLVTAAMSRQDPTDQISPDIRTNPTMQLLQHPQGPKLLPLVRETQEEVTQDVVVEAQAVDVFKVNKTEDQMEHITILKPIPDPIRPNHAVLIPTCVVSYAIKTIMYLIALQSQQPDVNKSSKNVPIDLLHQLQLQPPQ